MEQMLNSDRQAHAVTSRGNFPSVNIFKQGDDLVVLAEMPGINKEDLEISVQQNRLRISGTRSIQYDDTVKVHKQERASGKFERSFTLPQRVDADNVRAEYNQGLLALYLPRAEKDKPRQVKID
jgi:HSP20 family protein